MKIFAIMLVKNEVDIVGHVLKSAEKWADKIFILDNGSTDGTWELIQSMKNDCITPWKQYFGDYHNGLRADVFNEFKHLSEPGDWWCFKLDADEFYADDPREFLAKIPKSEHLVSKQSIDFFLTEEDLKEYTFTEDFSKDVEFLKYYKTPCWCEPRFFRYRKKFTWKNEYNSHYPKHAGVLSKQFILVKHYAYRNPAQLQRRLDSRNNSKVKKEGISWRWDYTNWKQFLRKRDDLIKDDKNLETYRRQPRDLGKFEQNIIKNTIKRILIALGVYN